MHIGFARVDAADATGATANAMATNMKTATARRTLNRRWFISSY
jgi:hypothetical protein